MLRSVLGVERLEICANCLLCVPHHFSSRSESFCTPRFFKYLAPSHLNTLLPPTILSASFRLANICKFLHFPFWALWLLLTWAKSSSHCSVLVWGCIAAGNNGPTTITHELFSSAFRRLKSIRLCKYCRLVRRKRLDFNLTYLARSSCQVLKFLLYRKTELEEKTNSPAAVQLHESTGEEQQVAEMDPSLDEIPVWKS